MEEDDAVDYLIYEDLKKEGFLQNRGRGGCLGVVALLLIPGGLLVFFHHAFF